MKVFVTGGTGLVGSYFIPRLAARGDEVVLLSRRPGAAASLSSSTAVVTGDPTVAGPWIDSAAECDAIVNLAGENIFGKRWNDAFKLLLRTSRVQATANCVEAVRRNPRQSDGSAKVLVNASAIGYYGPHGDEEIDEDAPAGSDLLGSICTDWENAARPAQDLGARLVLARIGVVLDAKTGALAKMLTPFRMFVGGPLGSGRQYLSWIHATDIAEILCFALRSPAASGPMNVTAPTPLTNKQFAKVLGKALGRPSFMPGPAFMLRLVLGEKAHLVLTGQRVVPKRALAWGFQFKFPDLESALADLLKRPDATV
jgi:uncharacterized protein (TIGR01777 family)